MNVRQNAYTDQLGRTVKFSFPPQRIISLVPSQTELLGDLGLNHEVVGITKFCMHPLQWRNTKEWVGGTKDVKIDKVAKLEPDLIIGNKEENEKDQIETLAKEFPVWMSDVRDLAGALEMIRELGNLTGTYPYAEQIAKAVDEQFQKLDAAIAGQPRKKAAYLIWRNPYMVAGSNTFIDTMLERAGYQNVFSDRERYPEIGLQELQQVNPEVIFLSSEPFPFKEKHLEEFRECCSGAEVQLARGDFFSWYGSRLLLSPDYFLKLHDRLW